MSNTCHPDHIADADKKVQPAPAPSGWGIDTSAGREILVYEGCSVIEAEQARQVLALQIEAGLMSSEEVWDGERYVHTVYRVREGA